jgi:predicted dehydrogenase
VEQKPLRIMIIGFSRHVQNAYLSTLLHESTVHIAAVCDLPAKEGEIRRMVPGVRIYHDPAEVIQSENVDAAIISTPNHLHCVQAVLCLDAGIHVLVDKPIALSVREMDGLMDVHAGSQCVLCVALPRRHSRLNSAITQLIRKDVLGKIVELDFGYRVPSRPGFCSSWRNVGGSGGGVLADAGYHILDLLVRLSGAKVQLVWCHLERNEYRVDVRAQIRAKFGDDGIANVALCLDESQGITAERLAVCGTKGSLFFHRVKVSGCNEHRELIHATPLEIRSASLPLDENMDREPLLDFIRRISSQSHEQHNLGIDREVVRLIQEAYEYAGTADR